MSDWTPIITALRRCADETEEAYLALYEETDDHQLRADAQDDLSVARMMLSRGISDLRSVANNLEDGLYEDGDQ